MTEPVPPCVILNEPQLAENIGAVARVMANFGLYDLRMVRPRDGWPQERAWPSASGADWPLNDAKVFATLEEAIADLQLLYATTARPRELHLPVITPREAAANLHAASASAQKIGLLFGGERAGLETHDIALAQAVVTIPIDPKFRSLNLAQAVSITAYEWRTAIADAAPAIFGDGEPPAPQNRCSASTSILTRSRRGGVFPPARETALDGSQPARRPDPRPLHRAGGANLPGGGLRPCREGGGGRWRSWRGATRPSPDQAAVDFAGADRHKAPLHGRACPIRMTDDA